MKDMEASMAETKVRAVLHEEIVATLGFPRPVDRAT